MVKAFRDLQARVSLAKFKALEAKDTLSNAPKISYATTLSPFGDAQGKPLHHDYVRKSLP